MTYASSSSPTTSRITATRGRGSSSSANARSASARRSSSTRARLRMRYSRSRCRFRSRFSSARRVKATRSSMSSLGNSWGAPHRANRASRESTHRHPASDASSTRAATTAGTRLHFPHPGASQHTHASRTASGAKGSQTDSEWHAHASSSDNFMCGCIAGPCEAASASSRTSAKSAPARYRAGGAASRVGGVLVGFGASSEGVPSTGLGFGGFCFDALDGSSSNSKEGRTPRVGTVSSHLRPAAFAECPPPRPDRAPRGRRPSSPCGRPARVLFPRRTGPP